MSDDRDWIDFNPKGKIADDITITCGCSHTIWQFSFDKDDDTVSITMYSCLKLSIWDRLKAAIKYFWSEETPCDDIIIEEKDAKRLRNYLNAKYEMDKLS